MLFWLVLASVLSSVSGVVYELNADTFQNSVDDGVWFVKFYTPWCGHCKTLAPIWDRLSNDAGIVASGVHMGGINCDAHASVCSAYHVMGYPTLFLISNGRMATFKGSRDPSTLKAFALEGNFARANKARELPRVGASVLPVAVAGETGDTSHHNDGVSRHGEEHDDEVDTGDEMGAGSAGAAVAPGAGGHAEGSEEAPHAQPPSAAQFLAAEVETAIAGSQIVLFTKSYCPYCKRALQLIERTGCQHLDIELTSRGDGADVQQYLRRITNQGTVPNIFINQEHVGGYQELNQLANSGGLEKLQRTCEKK